MSELDRILEEIFAIEMGEDDDASILSRAQREVAGLDESMDKLDRLMKSAEPDSEALVLLEEYMVQYDDLITQVVGIERDPDSAIEVKDGMSLIRDLLSQHTISSAYTRTWDKMHVWKRQNPDEFEPAGLGHMLKRGLNSAVNIVQNVRMVSAISKYVLGLYDLMFLNDDDDGLSRKSTCVVVEPNIRRVTESSALRYEDMMLEVLIHEDIHNRQFYKHPELDEMRDELIDQIIILGQMKDRWPEMKSVSSEELEERYQQVNEEIEVLMSTVESHADYYTDQVLKEIWGDAGHHYFNETMTTLRKDLRRKVRNILWKVTKHPMAEQGKRYVVGSDMMEELDDILGVDASDFILGNLPKNLKEIERPRRYIARHRLSKEDTAD